MQLSVNASQTMLIMYYAIDQDMMRQAFITVTTSTAIMLSIYEEEVDVSPTCWQNFA